MTLPYLSEKHKIAFADAFEAMTCNILGFHFKEPALEEKAFDSKGRLIERRFVHNNEYPRMIEHYDYEKGIVHKYFYELGRQILQFTLPIYSEQELRAKHTPIKEWIQSLGFDPKQVIEISVLIKSTDNIGGIQQETWLGCNGYFENALGTNIRKIVYDEKGNIYAIEKVSSSLRNRHIDSHTFDTQGNQIFQGHSLERDVLDHIEISLYDHKNRVIQRINTNHYGRYKNIIYYLYNENEVIRNKYSLNTKKITEESSKYIEKIGNNTCETIRTTGIFEEKEEITIFDPIGRILRKTETYYDDIDKSKELWKWEKDYTYNEAGTLIKEVSREVDYKESSADSYYTEAIRYNEQGQKIEHNRKSESKNSLMAIEECPDLEFQNKDKISLGKSLYHYNEQGDLIREDLRKWYFDEGVETDVETFSIHHFYEREEGYEAHLEVTVKIPN